MHAHMMHQAHHLLPTPPLRHSEHVEPGLTQHARPLVLQLRGAFLRLDADRRDLGRDRLRRHLGSARLDPLSGTMLLFLLCVLLVGGCRRGILSVHVVLEIELALLAARSGSYR